jgi:membrane-associated protease RseP (regulator of RpoE activity)
VFIILFWIPLLALHEAGHAVMATAVGWHVGQVIIGLGQTMWRFRAGTAVVEIRMLPVEGFVTNVPRNLRQPQLKSALIYFAGPGMDLLVASLVLVLVGPERLTTPSEEYWMIAYQSLAVAGLVQGVVNLVPHGVQVADGWVANDGLGILRAFTLPDSHYAAMVGMTFDEKEDEWQTRDPEDWWKRE